jgi:hypothetical protein
MVIPGYTEGYPQDGSSLGQSKTTIRNNLDGTFLTLAVDHVNNNGQPGSKPAGYHTVIHEVPQSSVSTVTGYNQVFCGVPGTLIVNGVATPTIPPGGDQQLYSLTGGGILSQLTGGVLSTNGYCWVGGILIQWGTGNTAVAAGAVTFPITFPHAVFGVQSTPTSKITTPAAIISLNTSGFTCQNNAGTLFSHYWMAIGN